MTFTDNGTQVPWEWMPQAMASGVEAGARRNIRRLGNLYRFRCAPFRWFLYAIGWTAGKAMKPRWTQYATVLIIMAMFFTVPAGAAEQPDKGDFAVGVRYGNISTESDFEDREGLYTAELEFFLEGGNSFGIGMSRPESDTDPSFNFFLARNWGPVFLRGSVNYLEFEADDATTAGLGFGVSFVPKPNFRIVALIEAAYVLGDLDLVRGFEKTDPQISLEHGGCHNEHCTEPPPPPLKPDVESVDITYQAGIGVAWFK